VRGSYRDELPPLNSSDYIELASEFDLFNKSYENIVGRRTERKPQLEAYLKRDIVVDLQLTFEESIQGCEKVVTYTRWLFCHVCHGTGSEKQKKCPECTDGYLIVPDNFETYKCPSCVNGYQITEVCKCCSGSGLVSKEETKEIKVPAGVGDKNILKLERVGHQYRYRIFTDLYIRLVCINSDDYIERKGMDIYTTNYIPLSYTVLGGEIKIKGLYDVVNIHIPKGSKENDVIKVKGGGVNRKGDHYVTLHVVIPRGLKDKIKSNILL
jgi:molecular chaperone DnaJ